jgi:hypothetical protein
MQTHVVYLLQDIKLFFVLNPLQPDHGCHTSCTVQVHLSNACPGTEKSEKVTNTLIFSVITLTVTFWGGTYIGHILPKTYAIKKIQP